jgi:hypothetical protein
MLQHRVRISARVLIACIGWFGVAAHGGVPTAIECIEGSEFIANAARARDNGIAREAFLDRLEADFAAIRAFPPALRWFARDSDDERFLYEAAARVFDRPQPPERHHADFLAGCLDRGMAAVKEQSPARVAQSTETSPVSS